LPDLLEQIRAACIEAKVELNAESISQIVRSLYPATSHADLVELVDEVLSSINGLGPLEELLFLPNLTDILVNRFDDVWIDRGNGLEKTQINSVPRAQLKSLLNESQLAGTADLMKPNHLSTSKQMLAYGFMRCFPRLHHQGLPFQFVPH
jgi:Flp pilus assembly CpaF family ATPase